MQFLNLKLEKRYIITPYGFESIGTKRSYDILQALMNAKGKPLSSEELCKIVYNSIDETLRHDKRTLSRLIALLNQKLENVNCQFTIETRRHAGYYLDWERKNYAAFSFNEVARDREKNNGIITNEGRLKYDEIRHNNQAYENRLLQVSEKIAQKKETFNLRDK